MSVVSDAEAIKIAQALYRERFDAFAQAAFSIVNPGQTFDWNWHIECLAEHLVSAYHGDIKQLSVNMPPRALKSFLISIAFPAWVLGRDPHEQFIVASHTMRPLAAKLSNDTRRLMESAWYKSIFPRTIIEKSTEDLIVTTENGHRLATSVGGSPLGMGCNFAVLDDANKPDEALSDTIRISTNDWIDNTLMSRLNDRRTGVFINVQQRVHDNDATGHILDKNPNVVHVKLPIENRTGYPIDITLGDKHWTIEPNGLLHPERFTHAVIAEIERDLGAYSFAGQYLQSPVPVGGGMLKPEWIKYFDVGKFKPSNCNVFILCDPAGVGDVPGQTQRKRKKSDWTAFQVVALAPDNNLYLVDMVRDKFNPTERINALFDLHRKWNGLCGKPPKVGYESYGLQSDLHYITEKMNSDNYRFNLIPLGGTMSKPDRIVRLIPDLQNSRWYFPNKIVYTDLQGRTFDLVAEMIKGEMMTFPVSKHDDCLDALSRIYDKDMNAIHPRLDVPDLIGSNEIETETPQSWLGW